MTYAVFGPEAARRAGACDELPWVAPSEGRLRRFRGRGRLSSPRPSFRISIFEFRNAGLGYSLERR